MRLDFSSLSGPEVPQGRFCELDFEMWSGNAAVATKTFTTYSTSTVTCNKTGQLSLSDTKNEEDF